MLSGILVGRGGCCGEEVSVSWVVEEFDGELLEEVLLVASLKGCEVQGGMGLLVWGVAGPKDQPHRPFLQPLELIMLRGVERG